MAKYDMRCDRCECIQEVTCAIEARNQQVCASCGSALRVLFSPTRHLVIPQAFRYTFRDLHGVTERELVQRHPELERINKSTFVPASERRKRREEALKREVEELEHVINANRSLVGGKETTTPVRFDYVIGQGEPT